MQPFYRELSAPDTKSGTWRRKPSINTLLTKLCYFWERRQLARPIALSSMPKSIEALIAPNPRVLSDDIWAKLLWAGLNLAPEDVRPRNPPKQRINMRRGYPFEMIRALAIVRLFAGLRRDEICRL